MRLIIKPKAEQFEPNSVWLIVAEDKPGEKAVWQVVWQKDGPEDGEGFFQLCDPRNDWEEQLAIEANEVISAIEVRSLIDMVQ